MENSINAKYRFWKTFLLYFVIGQFIVGFIVGINWQYFLGHKYVVTIRFLINLFVFSYYLFSSFVVLNVSQKLGTAYFKTAKQIILLYYIVSLFLFSSLINFTTLFSYLGGFTNTLIINGFYDDLLINNFKILFSLV